jgi:hypothetical protein
LLSPVSRSVLMFLLSFLVRLCSVPIFETAPELFERARISHFRWSLTLVWKFAQIILRDGTVNVEAEKFLVLKKLVEAQKSSNVAGSR